MTTATAAKTTRAKKQQMSVAAYLAALIEASPKKQYQIAEEVGFENVSALSAMKQGRMKMPIGRIEAFARSLGVDTQHLLRIVLREYEPDLASLIEQTLDRPMITDNERKVIEAIRETDVEDEALGTETARQKIVEAVKTLY